MASLCAILVLLMCNTGGLVLVSAQEENMCYGPGSIATTVILSVILTALIVCALYYLWKNYKSRKGKIFFNIIIFLRKPVWCNKIMLAC